MDTKLRNFSTNTITKTVAVILFIIAITASVVQVNHLYYLGYHDYEFEALFVEDYKDSEKFYYNDLWPALNGIVNSFEEGSSEAEGVVPYDSKKGYYYKISDGQKSFTNAPGVDSSFFEGHNEAFFAFQDGQWTFGENTRINSVPHYDILGSDVTLYLAYPSKYLQEKQVDWQLNRDALFPPAIAFAVSSLLSLLLLIYLIAVVGKKPGDNSLHPSKIDRVYSEVLLAAFIPVGALWLATMSETLTIGNGIGWQGDNIFKLIVVGLVTAAVSAVSCMLLLSLVRKIKAGSLFKHSLIYVVISKIIDFLRSFFDGRRFENYPLTKSLFYRQIIFVIVSAVLVFLTFVFLMLPPLLIFPPLMEIVVIYWYVKGNKKTYEEINKGFNQSLEEQMKAERMKVALITNVSHDLKTPLTSIISYVDLLSKEENLSDAAKDYIRILAEKSDRLKNILADLFDLSKSTSGNIQVEAETLDIKKLIEQTLADMQDKIEESEIQVRTKLPEKPLNIYTDGKKLYRVFQNVIDNALKYSLKGTRIYVELEEQDNRAIATIKNTAGYEMDFSADEILQRFNRGDSSRATEGSGLGLSIAESFTKVSGGDFKVDIDGDLFKVTISFNI